MSDSSSSRSRDKDSESPSSSQDEKESHQSLEVSSKKDAIESSNNNNNNNNNNSLRGTVGNAVVAATDIVNDNLIAARFAASASILLLTAYGIVHSPLLFRYPTVKDIPSKYFQQRQTLIGRLVAMEQPQPSGGGPIICHVYHLSLLERWLGSKATFDWFRNHHPSGKQPQQLLHIQIAGIQSAPHSTTTASGGSPDTIMLQDLLTQRQKVYCQLVARKVQVRKDHHTQNHPLRRKRPIPNLPPSDDTSSSSDSRSVSSHYYDDNTDQVAICKITYRPTLWQVFATDLALSLVQQGQACTTKNGYLYDDNDTTIDTYQTTTNIVDTTDSVRTLQCDVTYLQRLTRAELEAAQGSYGMWADPTIRNQRQDVMDEVHFQQTASIFAKLWRWIKGG